VGLEPTFYFRLMYKQNQTLVELLQPVVSSLGYELCGVEITGDGKGTIVRVHIDSVSGITLSGCERVSEQARVFWR